MSDDVKPYTREEWSIAEQDAAALAARFEAIVADDLRAVLVRRLAATARLAVTGHTPEESRQTHLRRYARMVEALGNDPGSVDAAIDLLIARAVKAPLPDQRVPTDEDAPNE